MTLIFGQSGQVAKELVKRSPDALFLSRADVDLSDPSTCAEAIRAAAPNAVINAAAYTDVDKAESEEALATAINAGAPGAMATACAEGGIPFVHISSDYVFDGHPTAPLGAYGRSKLAGEEAVRAAGGSYAILRTSWVFSSHGRNFVKTMLRLAETRDRLSIVADQIGGPTPAGAIAEACLTIATALADDSGKAGSYHFSGAPDVSWADFAREIFTIAGKDTAVDDILTVDYPTPARRPANSRLDCSSLAKVGLRRPDWRAALSDVLEELE